MLQKIESDDHQLNGIYIVFPMAYAVEGVRRHGLLPTPIELPSGVWLCDQDQLHEAITLAQGDSNRIVQVVPLVDMPHVARLLQHGLLRWINSMQVKPKAAGLISDERVA